MDPKTFPIDGLDRDQKLGLLEKLLRDLHEQGILSQESLLAIASDVMHFDYREDESLLTFSTFTDNEEE